MELRINPQHSHHQSSTPAGTACAQTHPSKLCAACSTDTREATTGATHAPRRCCCYTLVGRVVLGGWRTGAYHRARLWQWHTTHCVPGRHAAALRQRHTRQDNKLCTPCHVYMCTKTQRTKPTDPDKRTSACMHDVTCTNTHTTCHDQQHTHGLPRTTAVTKHSLR